ncbi:nitronate monooxygenase [Actinorugispora endophytica]|uniref:NAD(P)H-dependent flavin oxidoreductase YrpB (Nitropropane dioxygenase family) n=1 Tax=Actinorugispora endophytica TaxID=1605990 RepID=A0A4V3D8Y7_9ACTN|nr:nitronate monooxygenase [Actinorugispora endophytica]TDQ53730.1 NAD(P)H-dependent flavin oxidoreductase YrpB (nitropropane dioxygenase family) [Actinorugispora endophytica]
MTVTVGPTGDRSPGEAANEPPMVIQGGMGVGVSGHRLANAVARAGQLGVVSGVALDLLLARRLQQGDPDGAMRRAVARFPVPEIAERLLDRYFVPGGLPEGRSYRPVPRLGLRDNRHRTELTVLGNFVEVSLAKEGHDGVVGINYLEKIQLATPAAVYGAMLAGVDYVLMGAGIPSEIPALLDALAENRPGRVSVTVEGAASGQRHSIGVDPGDVAPGLAPPRRPKFLAIVSATALALYLNRSPATRPDGFVIEGPVAGGHSAPPRGRLQLDEAGEPVYGPRDEVDLAKVSALGLPFWLAGGRADHDGFTRARAAGAAGVQVGTAFALCAESGLSPDLKQRLLDDAAEEVLEVRNDPRASPTGFPFKVAQLPGTVADERVAAARPRLCDLSYLRTPYLKDDGAVGYRCPSEPVDDYVRKGGAVEETEGRRCLCNGLLATIGLGQHRPDGYVEAPLVTLGQDLDFLRDLQERHPGGHSAADVLARILGGEGGG